MPLPQALIPGGPYRTDDQEDALERIGRSLLARRRAATRRSSDPRAASRSTATCRRPTSRRWPRSLLSLDGRHLVIQGPPGSGKTWTSGRLIARLLAAGKTVGVASTSHKAIHKLLAEVEAGAASSGSPSTA